MIQVGILKLFITHYKLSFLISGLVFNQNYEDSEMMKKLLLCSNSSSETALEINDNVETAEPDSSSQDNIQKLKTLFYEVDNLNNINFNYDKIVHFVSQGNDFQIKLMTSSDYAET